MLEEKKVTLPSGLEVTIRKPGGLLLYDIASMAKTQATNGEGLNEQGVLATFRMIRRACVDPQFTDRMTEHGDPVAVNGKMHVDDLDPVDIVALGREIQEFSGIETMEDRLAPLSKTGTG